MKRGMLGVFLCLIVGGAFAEEAVVVIDDPKVHKTILSISEFKDLNLKRAEKLRAIVQKDLEFTGVFDFVSPSDETLFSGEELDSTKIHFNEWSKLGTEFLVKAEIQSRSKEMKVEARLYDVRSGRMIMGKKLKGEEKDLIMMARRFSNAVMQELTGKEGIFLTKILFISDQSGNKELYMMDFDGKNIEQLTKHKSIIHSPNWSRDGEFVSYSSYEVHGKNIQNIDASILNLETRKRSIFSYETGLNMGACWSPTRKEVAITLSKDGNPEIYIVKLDKTKKRRLTHHSAVDVECDWSPDGEKVVFSSGRAPYAHLFIMNREGTVMERLTYAGRYNSTPVWSPSGEEIVFSGYKKGSFDLYLVHPDGTDLRRLTKVEKKGIHNEGATFSPDGQHLVFSSNRSGKYELYIMNEDGSNERPLLQKFGNAKFPRWSPYLE